MTDSEESVAQMSQQVTEDLTRAMQAAAAAGGTLDRTLISLSGGALVLSMTFANQFTTNWITLLVLFLSWIAFGTSIVLVVFAMRLDQDAANQRVTNLANLLKQIQDVSTSVIATGTVVHVNAT